MYHTNIPYFNKVWQQIRAETQENWKPEGGTQQSLAVTSLTLAQECDRGAEEEDTDGVL